MDKSKNQFDARLESLAVQERQTISGLGSWYYFDPPHLDTLSAVWFAFYLSFRHGYFMGLLFMIAGYFVAGTL